MHDITHEIARALAEGRGVVALESTLIAHGLPFPDNLEVARACEAAVREAGAVPATIAVLGGRVRVGLDAADLDRLARPGTILKASRRDLAWAVARGLDAATTVSATLRIARRAGIGVMATGGLGGVHRDASTSFDVSTDLDELADADGMAVVCSGVKSILDVPATLEVLETRGVAVVGYRTDCFPAFTSTGDEHRLDARVESPGEVADLIRAHRDLALPGAVVVAQPVPEADALDRAAMETALAEAQAAARDQGVVGKAITPFLLDHLRHATEGRSLRANRSLIVNNARLAGEVAASLAGLTPRPSGPG
ncbi:pseudouridine-5'-phosphate glycosidase [Tundrisphaera sp. TA3]|uniref:pseudouridine-5'-phosphate glycosidase n=1 Tax=Tundrisphaera sp. TA3 TaxID=3435775 RepID=UPI003EBD2B64